MKTTIRGLLAVLATTTMLAGIAEARTLKWARSGDSLTLDPHGQNEGPTTALNQHIYEALTERDHAGKLGPSLATSWQVLPSDNKVWEFKLRPGVKFHDGAPLTADDVVFSYQRAMQPTSDFKGYLTSVAEVVKVDDLTVHIKTKGPDPLLVNNTSSIYIMSKAGPRRTTPPRRRTSRTRKRTSPSAIRTARGPTCS